MSVDILFSLTLDMNNYDGVKFVFSLLFKKFVVFAAPESAGRTINIMIPQYETHRFIFLILRNIYFIWLLLK